MAKISTGLKWTFVGVLILAVAMEVSNKKETSYKPAQQTPQEKKDSKLKECKSQLKLGRMQERAAIKAYDKGDFIKTQEHLRVALSNYMAGFKPCMNTEFEEELSSNTQRVNGILTNKAFRNSAAMQKFIKAATKD